MSSTWLWLSGVTIGFGLLAGVWWGWHQGGLALMQLGMGVC